MIPLIRRERVGSVAEGGGARILFASDLHLGLPWTASAARGLLRAVDSERPDVVLLGGDMVDNRRGFEPLENCVRSLAARCAVAAVAGNHDLAAGVDEVRRRVLRGGGAWLHDGPIEFRHEGFGPLRICGGAFDDAGHAAMSVACLHDPAAAEAASRAGFDLAFAGHLHGGQCVLFERRGRLYPGAWLNRWTGLRFTVGALRLFVSRGLGDTLPMRWNCPREVIVCEVESPR